MRSRKHGWWWKVLISGALLWLLTIVITVLMLNTNLLPTLILRGSFLVPFSNVLFAAERMSTTFPTAPLMIAFFVSGVLGSRGTVERERGRRVTGHDLRELNCRSRRRS